MTHPVSPGKGTERKEDAKQGNNSSTVFEDVPICKIHGFPMTLERPKRLGCKGNGSIVVSVFEYWSCNWCGRYPYLPYTGSTERDQELAELVRLTSNPPLLSYYAPGGNDFDPLLWDILMKLHPKEAKGVLKWRRKKAKLYKKVGWWL